MGVSQALRRTRSFSVSTELASLRDDELVQLLATAQPLENGINSTISTVEIAATTCFVKRIPLSSLEQQPVNIRSTANIFQLPLCYQYGVSSAGFGAWRELAALLKTTNWVLNGENSHFPILYHWRIMPRNASLAISPDEQAAIDRCVQYWGDSPAIRAKFMALHSAPAEIILFLEYLPITLRQWLATQAATGWPDAALLATFERELLSTLTFLNGNGLHHFDSHPGNILTDGNTIYFADFGLALDKYFELSPTEVEFLERHHTYDIGECMMGLCLSILSVALGVRPTAAILSEYVSGNGKIPLPNTAATILHRWSATALVMFNFLGKLMEDSTKTTPFPEAELAKTIAAARPS